MPDSDIGPLTQAAADGDHGAVAALIERYLPELRAFVRLRVGPEIRKYESHSDLVQSACREVIENADDFKFPGETAFKRWLFTTALRKIGKRGRYYRAEKRDGRREEAYAANSSSANDRVIQCYHSFASPSRNAIAKEEMERIEKAFESLSEEQREVVSLAHLVGLSRAEIADQTDRSEGAVRVLLHRALTKLSKLLAD